MGVNVNACVMINASQLLFCLDPFKIALAALAPVALCTVAAAVRKTAPGTPEVNTATVHIPADSAMTETQE